MIKSCQCGCGKKARGLFECLIGYPAFCAENASDTYKKIIDWPHHLHFPEQVHLSTEALDLMRQ